MLFFLSADFRVGEDVELTHCDGSTMFLRSAFLLVDPARRLLGIFTEHCGYYWFGTFDLRVKQLVSGERVAEHVF